MDGEDKMDNNLNEGKTVLQYILIPFCLSATSASKAGISGFKKPIIP